MGSSARLAHRYSCHPHPEARRWPSRSPNARSAAPPRLAGLAALLVRPCYNPGRDLLMGAGMTKVPVRCGLA